MGSVLYSTLGAKESSHSCVDVLVHVGGLVADHDEGLALTFGHESFAFSKKKKNSSLALSLYALVADR